MSLSRVAGRYAKSLLELAREQNKLDRVLEDVRAFRKATENRDFHLLLKSPIVKADSKRKIFDALFKGKFDELTMAFIDIILRKNRESYLSEIADAFMAQYRKLKEISVVRVRSATPLSADILEKIRQKLEASLLTEKNVEINTEVDPALIGGYVIDLGDRLYDASVLFQLKELRKEFNRKVHVN